MIFAIVACLVFLFFGIPMIVEVVEGTLKWYSKLFKKKIISRRPYVGKAKRD